MKKILLVLVVLFSVQTTHASKILIQMDDSQTNHWPDKDSTRPEIDQVEILFDNTNAVENFSEITHAHELGLPSAQAAINRKVLSGDITRGV